MRFFLPLSQDKSSVSSSLAGKQEGTNRQQNFHRRDFQASSQLELYEWLSLICRCVKEYVCDDEIRYSIAPSQAGFRPFNRFSVHDSSASHRMIYYVNYSLRYEWINLLNSENETPLLLLLRFSNRFTQHEETPAQPEPANSVRLLDVMHTFAWLVDNGCQLNKQNSIGNTVLHYAIINNYPAIIRLFLLKRYAKRINIPHDDEDDDIWNLANSDGLTPAMLLEQRRLDIPHDFSESFMRLYAYHRHWKWNLANSRLKLGTLNSSSKPYSYLRLFFERHYSLSR